MKEKRTGARWLLHAAVFTAIFAALFVHVSYTMRRNQDISAHNLQNFTREAAPVDVLFVGGSSTFVYWSPMQAYAESGISSYNYAGNSMSPALIRNLIIESRKHQTAQLYMIDLRAVEIMQHNPSFYTEEYLRLYTDVIPYSKNRDEMIRYAFAHSEAKVKNEASLYIDLIYYHGNWRNMGRKNLFYFALPESNGKKGFHFAKAPCTPVTLTDYSAVTEREPLTPDVEEVMRDLLDYLKSEGLNALFFINPFSEQDASAKMLYNSVEDMVGEYGYPFVDLNDRYGELSLDPDTDFYNVNHVNILGAQKVTSWMTRYLTRHFSLADHRGDAAYAPWDKDLADYERAVEAFIAEYRAYNGLEMEETP